MLSYLSPRLSQHILSGSETEARIHPDPKFTTTPLIERTITSRHDAKGNLRVDEERRYYDRTNVIAGSKSVPTSVFFVPLEDGRTLSLSAEQGMRAGDQVLVSQHLHGQVIDVRHLPSGLVIRNPMPAPRWNILIGLLAAAGFYLFVPYLVTAILVGLIALPVNCLRKRTCLFISRLTARLQSIRLVSNSKL